MQQASRARLRAFALFASVTLAATAAAQTPEGTGQAPITVTASRIEQSVADALPSVTVITREDIDATQSRDLLELLSREEGIEIARSGGQGAQSSIFMRGTNSNQVLVLVDGTPINTVELGAANLGGFPTDAIERIEIVRGNLSSLYGSEAIGGVVQITTRGGGQPGADALVEAGQGRTRDASAAVTSAEGGASLSLSAGYRSQDAIPAIDVAQVPFANPAVDGNWNRHATLRLQDHTELGDFRAWAWGNRNDTQWVDPYNASPTIPSTEATQVEQRSQDGYGLSASHRFGGSTVSLSAAETRDDAIDVSNIPNNDLAGDNPLSDNDNDQFRSRNRTLSLQDTTRLAPGVDLLAGGELANQLGSFTATECLAYDPVTYACDAAQGVLTAVERRVDSVWLGNVGRIGSQQWQLNVRNDRYSDFGSATTGLAGWGWSFAPGWKLTTQGSTGFRAPSFEELYYPNESNPLLQPERARSLEAGLRWNAGGTSAALAVFRNRVSQLIEFTSTGIPYNVGHAAMDGAELQGSASLGALRLGASLSLDHPRDLDNGQPLLRRASYAAKLSAVYRAGPWTASADLQRTGARDDLDYVTGATVQLSPYDLARATLAYRVTKNVSLQLRAENLFNASYQLVDGYNTLPRMLVAGVAARL